MTKKNNILLCVLILSIAFVGVKCKSNRNSEIPGEDGFKVIIEETNNTPIEFYPDSLAKHRSQSWKDITDSAPKRYLRFFRKHAGVTTIKISNNKIKLTIFLYIYIIFASILLFAYL